MEELKPALLRLSEDVGTRLRRRGMYANGVQLTIRYPDFHTFTRQCKIPSTDITNDIYKRALKLFIDNRNPQIAIRALTVTAIDLEKEKRVAQMSLFDAGADKKREKNEKLQATIDRIRDKYGNASVQSATVMGAGYKKKQNPFGDKPENGARRWDKNDR